MSTPSLAGRPDAGELAGPAAARGAATRRPVVAILDTGVADHTWFRLDEDERAVERWRYERSDGSVVKVEAGPRAESEGGENDPNIIDPLQGLIDPFFGHGTFIAGLIHQAQARTPTSCRSR